ncbi:lipid A export permease/ATP-binding protein MsbA [Piscinibacter sp. HJYY11]|uniref:lipid A export permease/ATP-binding protein MsbA n=1 Tax=Piscinibacter sp. HJYY11 TaxID=2801333 RepID=UPI00191DCE90|nr:lipid A export permease/ATP-binding protein MsbA [Piscinibacter sp. HJYY11]MBL0727383.1 lipid A export permease/ATP-binding protein MsbA [Piscinibacter sp. HJYY11]
MPQPTQPLRQRLARVAPYFAGAKLAFVLAAVGASIGAATEPALAAMMKPLLDGGFTQQGNVPLWAVPAVIIGLFMTRGIAGFLVNYALSWAANGATLKMRHDMFEHVLLSHASLFSQQTASSLINTVVYEVQSGTQTLVGAAQTLLKDSFTAIALLIYLLWINWQLTLFIAVLLPPVALTVRYFSRRMHRISLATQSAADDIAYVMEENTLAWRIVRLHDAKAAQKQRFNAASTRMRQLSLKGTVASSAITPVTQLISACALSAVIVVALWQSSTQGATVGGFVAFITAMLMLISPLRHLADVAGPVTRGLAAIQRGLDLMQRVPVEKAGTHTVARARGELEFSNVSLRYNEDAVALNGLSLQASAGEKLALVGPSGAGKSTLVNLLPRFLDPTEGEIRLDGVPLQDWELSSLRRQFALVSQDVVLFNDTIAANVAVGSQGMDLDRVRSALASANLLDFVDEQPDGVLARIGHNGNQLSGGQRQRLAIARAIYKDAPVLILDEATSALDSESEHLVQQALERLMEGRTTIVVAHRLSTIEKADRIAVLDQGRLVELGTRQELLDRGGLFARLHALQFKL